MLFFLFAVPPPFAPVRHSKDGINLSCCDLALSHPHLNEVLKVDYAQLVQNPIVAPLRQGPPELVSQAKKGRGKDLQGFPPDFEPCWREVGVHSQKPPKSVIQMSFAYDPVYHSIGVSNTYHYLYICKFLRLNGDYVPSVVPGDGECMFSSLRRQFKCFQQYSNTMFRRQIAQFMLDEHTWLFPKVKELIRENLGEGDGGPRNPGPFSYLQYVEFISKLGNWGDLVTLHIVSYMMGAKVTVVFIPSLSEVRIRHDEELSAAHLILLFNQNHFSPVGKYCRFCSPIIVRF